jgi:hypothetical protein
MKNIHLLPTDKPSRLHLGKSGLVLCDLVFNPTTINSQNIYITSDEKIKEGDWVLDLDCIGRIRKADKLIVITSTKEQCWYYKKIILTTDQDLIKDGVQAIDDEFLEWFVKNPSCESVEVEPDYDEIKGDYYRIVILQEEPKQETLEEAAEKYSNDWEEIHPELDSDNITPEEVSKIDFIAGAKWQQERMYSEKEVESLLHKFMQSQHPDWHGYSTTKWFEQFKKK